jgi:hypothetical protein
MNDTTKREARSGDETTFILPNGIFLGASESDILAIEREASSRTTARRWTEDPSGTERRA